MAAVFESPIRDLQKVQPALNIPKPRLLRRFDEFVGGCFVLPFQFIMVARIFSPKVTTAP